MKKLSTFAMLGLLLPAGASFAAPLTWKIESEKTIYWAPEAVVELAYTSPQADNEYWDRIDISVRYDVAGFAPTVERIKEENPGYQIGRVPLLRASNYLLEIPSLEISEELTTVQSGEGPATDYTMFVSRKDSAKARAAVKQLGSFLRISGQIAASAPKEVLQERASLPASICTSLGEKADLHALILAYPELEAKVQAAAQLESNRRSLRNQLLSGCIALEEPRRIDDWKDALSMPLRAVRAAGSFVAETWKKESVRELLPLTYELRKQE